MRGLTTKEALELQNKYGKNELTIQKKENFLIKVFHVIKEPIFLLLIIATIIYFVLGEPEDAATMLVFVLAVITMDLTQEIKTDNTLNALKNLSAPHIKVIRDDEEKIILSSDLVPSDLMLISEGTKIPADGKIIKCSDFCVDESSLTGESNGVWKKDNDKCYAGTLVIQGSAYILVEKIGLNTEYGKIGLGISSAPIKKTPLQKQTGNLVKVCSIIAVILFLLVTIVTYLNLYTYNLLDRIIKSILSGITLAMSMMPEEFPVVLTVFLSMGAIRLAKKQSLVRKLPAVETLGAVSVLCVDKTGTITKNQMTVKDTWSFDNDTEHLCHTMGLACEPATYDPMEKAMLSYCDGLGITKEHIFGGNLIKEYAFTNELKMMGHVWNHDGKLIIASKGSAENILNICDASKEDKKIIQNKIKEMSQKGLRVIAIGITQVDSKDKIPNKITDCNLTFCGLIGLEDPPRESVKKDIQRCHKAGIRVVMITGDNGITASAIAKKVGFKNSDSIITGEEIECMTDDELKKCIKTTNVFSRVIPEHKMRIVKAFKEIGEIVAMTGDGVNDAPALKYADIGISMGKRGSEVSREASDLILMDDNFSTIVDTVKDGRRIYDNIKKAIGYIFAIHIPIALASLFAPMLGIMPENILLLPVHIVLLELVINPTCSIVLERQPAESDIMTRKPRKSTEKMLNKKSIIENITQGIIIFLASFGSYLFVLNNYNNIKLARAIGLVVILFANLFLVQVNSSNTNSVVYNIKRLLKDKVMWIVNFITVIGIIVILYTPVCDFLKLESLNFIQLLISFVIAAVSVLWYEIVKVIKKLKYNRQNTTDIKK